MGTAISSVAYNNEKKIYDISSEVDTLKHIAIAMVISILLVYSFNLYIKNKRYLSDLFINNHVNHRLQERVYRENPFIPENIIHLEILVRLPLKSLLRFQCACKSWQTLISSDPVFKKSYVARRPSVDLVVGCRRRPCIGTLVFEDIPDHPLLSSDMELDGSGNGLACFYRDHWNSESILSIKIWNPVTRKYTYVSPPSTAYSDPESTDRWYLAFGFDPNTNDYKVICIANLHVRMQPPVASVYSCNACSWINIDIPRILRISSRSGEKFTVSVMGTKISFREPRNP